MNEQLKKWGAYVKDVKGDGNCLFRALSDQLEGTEDRHLCLRQETAEYIKQHRSLFEPFIDDDTPFHVYVRRLSRSGCYGEHASLVAFSRRFCVNIAIHQNNQPVWYLETIKGEPALAKTLHLVYHDWEHYSSIRNIDGPHHGPANVRLTKFLTLEKTGHPSDFAARWGSASNSNLYNFKSEKFTPSTNVELGDLCDANKEVSETITSLCYLPLGDGKINDFSTQMNDEHEDQDLFERKRGSDESLLIDISPDRHNDQVKKQLEPRTTDYTSQCVVNQRHGNQKRKQLAKKQRKASRMEMIRSRSLQISSKDTVMAPGLELEMMKLQKIHI